MVDVLDDDRAIMNFLRMEKWLFDSPDHAGEAYRQFIKEFVQANKLIKNELELGGRRVDLGNITMPVLNIYAQFDHLVPPKCSIALGPKLGTDDYTELEIPSGHIGIYVGGKAQKMLAPTVARWIGERS
jgi:polyhydroxyalkanoate synthase